MLIFGKPLASFALTPRLLALLGLVAFAPGCGTTPSSSGSGSGDDGGSGSGGGGSGGASGSGSGGASGSGSGGASGSGSGSGGASGSGSGSGSGGTDGGTPVSHVDGGAPSGSAAGLAGKLGKPARFLIGLGSSDPTSIGTQGLKPDFYDEYLVNVGAGDWTTWNPGGTYVDGVAKTADGIGAVPMFTLYQMATNGDGDITDITDSTFMTPYWANVVLLFQRLAVYGKPALVNFEPDFWGYTEQAAPGGDPTKLAASVSLAPDCASLPNTVAGLAQCLVQIARKYAPKAYVGFSPSEWGGASIADVVTFMNAIGAGKGDFVVVQTLDRDAGCFEAATESDCMRSGSGWYWDETNATHPNFQDHLATAQAFNTGIKLPLLWWQTPLGVPSTTPGGKTNAYRDNRVHYFLTHPDQLVAVGGLGVVFGAGSGDCTEITSDNGQWKTLSTAYFASPVALP